MILKATDADGDCVLACALAASFLLTQSHKERTPEAYLNAAKANLVIIRIVPHSWSFLFVQWLDWCRFSILQAHATSYEKSVLALVTASVHGQTEQVIDLHFEVSSIGFEYTNGFQLLNACFCLILSIRQCHLPNLVFSTVVFETFGIWASAMDENLKMYSNETLLLRTYSIQIICSLVHWNLLASKIWQFRL